MKKPVLVLAVAAIVLIGLFAWRALALPPFGETASNGTNAGVVAPTPTVEIYTQEAFVAELLTADGTTVGSRNARARYVNAAINRFDVSADDPYAWVIGYASVHGYLPDGFNPKGDASMEAIAMILDCYTNGWDLANDSTEVVEVTKRAFETSPEIIQVAAANVASRLGVSISPISPLDVPSPKEVKALLDLIKDQ